MRAIAAVSATGKARKIRRSSDWVRVRSLVTCAG
jgi:hypothetical protein